MGSVSQRSKRSPDTAMSQRYEKYINEAPTANKENFCSNFETVTTQRSKCAIQTPRHMRPTISSRNKSPVEQGKVIQNYRHTYLKHFVSPPVQKGLPNLQRFKSPGPVKPPTLQKAVQKIAHVPTAEIKCLDPKIVDIKMNGENLEATF